MRWYSILEAPFQIYGLAVKEPMNFCRLPASIANQVNDTVTGLASDTAGVRARFRTDSPRITLRYTVLKHAFGGVNLSFMGKSCADCYVNGIYRGGRPQTFDTPRLVCEIKKQAEMQDVDIYLPSYNSVLMFEIGLEEGAVVEAPRPYAIQQPMVFYGSSITQGAGASRPGVNYVAQVARAMDADFVNLGFAGGARGEQVIADYIAGLDMSLFVLDYDHNAPTVEHLEKTHENFYATVRRAQPELPILMLTRPDFDGDYTAEARQNNIDRRAVVQATYEHAKAAGDQKVWFIDGETLFGDCDRDACTADACHPNDLGFYRMAQAVLPVVRDILLR